MDSYPGDFPFGIMDVVELLHLRIRRRQANSVYVDCPFCGDRRGKMNVNFVKNVWRCNYCDEHGGIGMLSVDQWGESHVAALSPYLLWKISSRRDFNAYRQDTGLPGISEGY